MITYSLVLSYTVSKVVHGRMRFRAQAVGGRDNPEAVEPRKPRLQIRAQVRPFTRASAWRRWLRRQGPAPGEQRTLRA